MPSTSARFETRVGSAAAAASVIVAAAVAMACTLPGRTHGLGLITTRLLADFPTLDERGFTWLNVAATLLGSLFCFPCGWLLDRFGVRALLAAVLPALAAAVAHMSYAVSPAELAVGVTLTRALGQSMLSVVSIAMLSKWFRGGSGPQMGAYAVLMTALMAVGTGVLAARVSGIGWRAAWREMALVLAIVSPLAWLCAAPFGRLSTVANDEPDGDEKLGTDASHASATLQKALGTGCFWAFALCISLFGLASSGVSLLQQIILAERGLSESVFHSVLVIGLVSGMVANLIGGWLARRWSMTPQLACAMLLLAGSLAALPMLQTAGHAYAQAVIFGVAGGMITVLFFTVWRHAFGPRHIGRIQGLAQMMTVLASAAGPVLFSESHANFGSYMPILMTLSGVSALLGVAALLTAVPSATRGDWLEPVTVPSLSLSQEPT